MWNFKNRFFFLAINTSRKSKFIYWSNELTRTFDNVASMCFFDGCQLLTVFFSVFPQCCIYYNAHFEGIFIFKVFFKNRYIWNLKKLFLAINSSINSKFIYWPNKIKVYTSDIVTFVCSLDGCLSYSNLMHCFIHFFSSVLHL